MRAAAERSLQARVELVEADAATFVDRADIVMCVAASHAFGDAGAALQSLRECVVPGGRVLFADGFWEQAPTPEQLKVIGELPDRSALRAAAEDAGFRIEHDDVSTLAEWDAFEAAWRSGLETSGDPEARAFAATRREQYEAVYRGALGFAWLVVVPRGG